MVDERSGRFHPKRGKRCRGLRQPERRLKSKRLKYNGSSEWQRSESRRLPRPGDLVGPGGQSDRTMRNLNWGEACARQVDDLFLHLFRPLRSTCTGSAELSQAEVLQQDATFYFSSLQRRINKIRSTICPGPGNPRNWQQSLGEAINRRLMESAKDVDTEFTKNTKIFSQSLESTSSRGCVVQSAKKRERSVDERPKQVDFWQRHDDENGVNFGLVDGLSLSPNRPRTCWSVERRLQLAVCAAPTQLASRLGVSCCTFRRQVVDDRVETAPDPKLRRRGTHQLARSRFSPALRRVATETALGLPNLVSRRG
ncbi:unnamed protein product [Protopolystoma xenopodis]|uniref:Uncharacterized protein n=1 Tax=Protopolystoma xenopodis TaxID=117903 RepID=A0A3S5FDS6_9PLAT|nr:unnamed protein product [Protopolystoma xenopodis]